MAAEQRIMWTVLPNGRTANRCRLSVFVTPRLRGGPNQRLDDYAAFVDWPAQVNAITWNVRLAPGPLYPATRVSAPARSDLWAALLPPDTFVRSQVTRTYETAPIASYPVRNVVDFLEARYKDALLTSPLEPPTLEALDAPGKFQEIGWYDPRRKLPEKRTEHEDEIDRLLGTVRYVPFEPLGTAGHEVGRDFVELLRFHAPRWAPNAQGEYERIVAPVPQPDFHELLALLGEHPVILRLLGLVVDLEVDLGTSILPANVEAWVQPTWTPPGAVLPTAPRTAALLSTSPARFEARPDPAGSDLTGRYLAAGDTGRFDLVQIDPDGAAIKSHTFAENLQRAGDPRHSTDDTPDRFALPSLRSAGLALARVGRAQRFHEAMVRAKTLDTSIESLVAPLLYADDLTRGYRIDVWDDRSNAWRSLMRRQGTYTFETLPAASGVVTFDDEAVIGTGPTKSPDGSSPNLWLQESLFSWIGWSLAAPRPGQSLTTNRDDPDEPFDESRAVTRTSGPDWPFVADASAAPGTLPRLRFGWQYRLRVRAVDLAGNSVALADALDDPSVTTTPEAYRRFEPVASPPVLMKRATEFDGDRPERIVLRSNFDAPPAVEAERWVSPPKISQWTAELHGLYDTIARPGVPSTVNAAAYAAIVDREDGSYLTSPQATFDPTGFDAEPFFDVDALDVPFLPDVMARAAALHNMPGPSLTDFANPSAYVPFSPRPDAPWPASEPFRIVLREAATLADQRWEIVSTGARRVLVVYLQKARRQRVLLSSRPLMGRINEMGMYRWLAEALGGSVPAAPQSAVTNGRYWALTPPRVLTLVHAVKQPLATPEFENGQLTVARTKGQTLAVLRARVPWNQRSTSRVEMLASWPDFRDDGAPGVADPAVPDPTLPLGPFPTAQASFPITPNSPTDDLFQLLERHEFGDTKFRRVTYRMRAVGAFDEHFRVRRAVTVPNPRNTPIPLDAAGVVPGSVIVKDGAGTTFDEGTAYEVDDVAGTLRFALAAPVGVPVPAAGATVRVSFVAKPNDRVGAVQVRNVPSSARPSAPNVLYVLPTFAWTRTEDPGGIRQLSRKRGNGLRVYLDRPWWSSGGGELLGVVLARGVGAGSLPSTQVQPYVTNWGFDPVRSGLAPDAYPFPTAFRRRVNVSPPVTLAELPSTQVDVVGHPVDFDAERKLWFCDLEINPGQLDWPFIRLALCRYQPNSLPTCEISPVVLADFAQLAPDRTAVVIRDPAAPNRVRVVLIGQGYDKARGGPLNIPNTQLDGFVRATLEIRQPSIDSDLGWAPVVGQEITLAETSWFGQSVWSGELTLSGGYQRNRYRVVVEEFQRYKRLPILSAGGQPVIVENRPVHVDVIPF